MTTRPNGSATRLVSFGVALAVAFACWYRASTTHAEGPQGFTFALLGDPQIGYGRGGEYGDAGRFAQVIERVNHDQVSLSIVAGDLVQDRTIWQEWFFGGTLARLQGRVLLAAGNHDVVDESSLEDYRERHGKDFFDVVVGGCAFIILNSETARDRSISTSEFNRQWAFLEATLRTHKLAGRDHIVLVMHRPPFVGNEQEADEPTNWPKPTRRRLLALARKYGVQWILAGHLHRTLAVDTADGIHIVVSAGSARSFDQSPIAYHKFYVEKAGLRYQLVKVAPPPPESFSVPGLRQWTPRLLDFSIRHWLFTAFYVTAGLFALAASRALGRSRRDVAEHRLWRVVAIALFAFGANMQLDIDELIGEVGRIVARLSGVYAIRHLITGGAAIVVAVGGAVLLTRFYLRSKRKGSAALALCMLSIPTAWFCLSVISNHNIGMLFNEMWWDLLTVVALLVITMVARRARRAARTEA